MLRRVARARIEASKELSASNIRVTRIGELRITLAVTSNQRAQPLHSHRRENLESYIASTGWAL
jgi:hypothetical protein